MVAWTQLLLLACMIAISASQTCDDITCCSGRVCVDVTPGSSGTNWTKCVPATSCDQLECPMGQVCVSESRSSGAPPRVSCQASCEAVRCPDFLQCVEKFSGTECVIPDDCFQVECPPGTECQLQQKGKKEVAVCLGSSCESIDCFSASECYEFALSNPLDFFRSKTYTSGKTDTSRSETSGSGVASALAEVELATCLPTCDGVDICPPGLVCDTDDYYQLVCREPQSCEELECPMGQECQEVMCEYGRAHGRTKRSSTTKSGSSTRTRGNMLVQCVGIELASGSGMEETMTPTTPTETEPIILERVDDSELALLDSNSAHSLIATSVALVLPICVYSLLYMYL